MNIAHNLIRSTLLAAVIFWVIVFTDDIDINLFPYIIFSLIPIFLSVSIVILITICSIFWLSNYENNTLVFKHYFPYYAVIVFFVSCFGAFMSDFNIGIIAFFTSAYITTCQAWVWFSKT